MRSAMRNRLASLRILSRRPRRTSDEEVVGIAYKLWSQLDTPLSLGMALLAKAGDFEQLLRIDVDPGRYLDSDWSAYQDDVQAVAFLRKMPLKVEGVDREKAAWAKFLEAEIQCQRTNERFRNLREGNGCSPAVHAVLHSTQWKISRWLRDLSPQSWALRCRFGPGADNLTKGSCVSPYHKLSRLSSTEDFADGAMALVYSHPSWRNLIVGIDPDMPSSGAEPWLDIETAPGNKLTFVPKTALIDRSIAIEPRLNIYAQLGLGALLRQRLKRFAGLDLDTQVPSQELAYIGSRDGTVATIDLSSASDTIAKELVRELLPDPWFQAMDWCRSKVGLYSDRDGIKHTIYYQKFSSMGNGFTFELESMIFYALALSCGEMVNADTSLIRAYGDDIAIPVSAVALLEEVLAFCGFTVNPRKSFSSGVFRESCGADFFNGKDVRPFYQKESLDYVESLFRLANGLRRVAHRRNHGYGCDSKFHRLWTDVVGRIPQSLRAIRGPFRSSERFTPPGITDVTSDDSYLAVNLDEAMSSPFVRRDPNGWCGWLFVALIPSGRLRPATGSFANLYAWALYSCRDGSTAESSPHTSDGTRMVPLRGNGPRKLVSACFTAEFIDVESWC